MSGQLSFLPTIDRKGIWQLQVIIPWNFQLKTLSKHDSHQVSHPFPLCWGPWAAVNGQLPMISSYIQPQDRGADCSQVIRPEDQVDLRWTWGAQDLFCLNPGDGQLICAQRTLSCFWQFLFPQSKISNITLQSSIPRLSTYQRTRFTF